MKETALEVNKRKIRNGLRKQAEKIQREKEKVWDRLKSDGKRKLRGSWSVDAAQDLESLYSLDLEDELTAIFAAEIATSK